MTDEIKRLQDKILSDDDSDNRLIADKLIELQGVGSMNFFQSLFMIDPFLSTANGVRLHDLAGYAVRQLTQLEILESVKKFKFCPSCAKPLIEFKHRLA